MLRAVELGISIEDLDLLDIGLVLDMFTERINDMEEQDQENVRQAMQEDFDNF